jgi:cobalt-zinc-cadmium efflux system membrane fusion protein
MYSMKPFIGTAICVVLVSACSESSQQTAVDSDHTPSADYERGAHNGRLLEDGDFTLELAIFETGVPPEFRAWVSDGDTALSPNQVDLRVTLNRLGEVIDNIGFSPQGDFLRGDTVIYEPHSFVVNVSATHAGKNHNWQYDSLEGRTMIEPAVRDALEITTELAGPGIIEEVLPVYGRIVANTNQISQVTARFDGRIETVFKSIGDRVSAGDRLLQVESNQSLTSYTITSPIDGIVTVRNAGPGEQTEGRLLFTIMNTATVWADLSVFPSDIARVSIGTPVRISSALAPNSIMGSIAMFMPATQANQSITARVLLDNTDGYLLPGSWVNADIEIAQHSVGLAVRKEALQSFRDFTVVFAQVGDEYEVRMLELGRESNDWIEVLGGLLPGTRYVTQNSYILKADVEKSGASHDH